MATMDIHKAALAVLFAVVCGGAVPSRAAEPVQGATIVTHYRTATVDGLSIFYREAGPADGPVVLLLHGFPTSSHMFRNLISALADRYRGVAEGIKQGTRRFLFDPEANRFLRRIYVRPDGTTARDQTIDSSVYGLWYFGMFPADDPQIVSTMKAVYDRLWCKTQVGGIARYEYDWYYQVSQDIANVPGNPWFICTMWYGQWLVSQARTLDDLSQAREILDWVAAAALPKMRAVIEGLHDRMVSAIEGQDCSRSVGPSPASAASTSGP